MVHMSTFETQGNHAVKYFNIESMYWISKSAKVRNKLSRDFIIISIMVTSRVHKKKKKKWSLMRINKRKIKILKKILYQQQ